VKSAQAMNPLGLDRAERSRPTARKTSSGLAPAATTASISPVATVREIVGLVRTLSGPFSNAWLLQMSMECRGMSRQHLLPPVP
jgi:hypothetical protein